MAQTATQHVFDVSLSDVDRGVYEALPLKVARHPSESDAFMITRVLAFALQYEEGLAFSQGLFATDEPAMWIRDLTGRLRAWIEVGTPDAARLHKASKACERVVVYCHKDVDIYLRGLAGQRVHAPERVSIVAFERRFIDALVAKLARRNTMAVSVTEGEVYVDLGGEAFTTTPIRRSLPG
ncbi:MAG: YaeQ family protein [Myxococcales bacterium]|nr:YaeQ family protein [Myxococcales bacterium]